MAIIDILLPLVIIAFFITTTVVYLVFGRQRKRSTPYSRRRINAVRGELNIGFILGLTLTALTITNFIDGDILFGVIYLVAAVTYVLSSVLGVLTKDELISEPAEGAWRTEGTDGVKQKTTVRVNIDGTVTRTTNTRKRANRDGVTYTESSSTSSTTVE